MEETSNQSSEKNITDRWLDNIFEVLMRLESYERLMKEGCEDLKEYLDNPNLDIADIQYKNYKLFLTEIEILIEDTKHLIEKKQMLRILVLLNWIKNYEEQAGGFIRTVHNEVTKEKYNETKPEFSFIFSSISRLRGLFVSSLWKLLSPSAKDSIEGLPE